MKTFNNIAFVLALTLMASGTLAQAGTLSGAVSTLNGVSTTTSPPKISAPNQVLQIKHVFGVAYYGPDKNANFTCGAKLEYSDGSPSEMVPVKFPMDGVGRMRQYTKPGKYTASLSGAAYNGYVACLGSASTTLTIEDGLPHVSGKGGGVATTITMPAAQQAIQGMTPIDFKSKVKQVVIRGGNVFAPGSVSLYSTISLDKPDSNCLLEMSVLTANQGSDALNVEIMKNTASFGGGTGTSNDYNPGMLNFSNTGKFRLQVRARTDVENHCTGTAFADFEIKRQKMGGDTSAPIPAPAFGSFISKITAVESANSWGITVHGSGNASCNYYVRTWILPQMSIFGEQAMVYEKNVLGAGKGMMTVAKQGDSNVLVETLVRPEDKVDNKGCLGTPSLELKPTPAPVSPPQPKKGTVMGLSVPKIEFALGEPIPGLLKLQGDNCHFVFRVRKLPFIEYNDDVVFAVHTKSLTWDLNNLGQTLPPGKWTVISQPGNEALNPGEIRCEIGGGAGVGQVIFTVLP
jgi:hypothetical protein